MDARLRKPLVFSASRCRSVPHNRLRLFRSGCDAVWSALPLEVFGSFYTSLVSSGGCGVNSCTVEAANSSEEPRRSLYLHSVQNRPMGAACLSPVIGLLPSQERWEANASQQPLSRCLDANAQNQP